MADIIELGQRVKAKYPGAYDSLSDEELGARIRAKFEAYRDYTDPLPAGAEKTGLPGISRPDPQMREAGMLDKAGVVAEGVARPVDTFLRSGNRAMSQSIQGVGGATEALGGYLQQNAREHGAPGIIGGPVKQLGNEIRKFGEGMGRGGAIREDLRGVAGENFLEKPEVAKNPEYWLDLAGQISGSMLSMMAPTAGVVGQADKAMQFMRIKQQYLPLVRTAAGVSTASMVETLFDAGNSYQEALDMGASEETARAVVAETFKRELPPTLAFNAFGIFNDMMKGGVKKFALSSLSEGLQESAQGIAQRQSLGLVKPQTDQDIYGPAPFEFMVGAMGGAFGEAVLDRVGQQSGYGSSAQVPPAVPAGEAVTGDDTDGDGPSAGEPAQKTYTPEQYAQAFEMTMKREKAASPTEIRKALGVDYKTAAAILQQMQDEGWVKRMGPKGSKFWKIVKRPEAQAEQSQAELQGETQPSTATAQESEELDPLRTIVYQGQPQELIYESESALPVDASPALENPQEAVEDRTAAVSPAETVRPERDPSLDATPGERILAKLRETMYGEGSHESLKQLRKQFPELSKEEFDAAVNELSTSGQVFLHETDRAHLMQPEDVADLVYDPTPYETSPKGRQFVAISTRPQPAEANVQDTIKGAVQTDHLTNEQVDQVLGMFEGEDSDTLPDGTKVKWTVKKLTPTRAGIEVSDRETGEVAPASSDKTQALMQSFKASIAKNESLGDITKFMQRVERESGLSAARGEIQPKEAYDILESAVNEIVAEQGREAMQPDYDFKRAIKGLRAMMGLLPTQSSRSETQVKFQQFSTPPTLAYMAARLTGMTSADTVLEPSAGTGGLASWAKAAGASVVTNEIDEKRADLLTRQGYRVTRENAEQIHNILPDDIKPTVVLMNPPFSASGVRGTKNSNNVGYRHVDQAFSRLEPGGRLVVILGEGATLDAATAQPFWKAMAAKGNIRANIGVDGKEYAKYGTTFGNRVIVIDKTGPTPGANWLKQRAEIVKGDFKTVEDAWDAVSKIAKDRPQPNRAAPAGQASESAGSVRADSVQPQPGGSGQSASAQQRPAPNRGGSGGRGTLPEVSADQPTSSGERPAAKPAAVPAGESVGAKPSGKLPAAADDDVPALRPVEQAVLATIGRGTIAQDDLLIRLQESKEFTFDEMRAGLAGLHQKDLVDVLEGESGFSYRVSALGKQAIQKSNPKPASKPDPGPLVIQPLLGGKVEVIDYRPKPKPEPKSEAKPEPKPGPKAEPTAAEIDAKHGELLKDAAAAARERLKNLAKGNQLNAGLDPQTLLDLATVAAEFMHAKGIAFKKWSEPFVEEIGEWVREHLQAIRDQAEEVYDSLREKAVRALSRPEQNQSSSSEEDVRKVEPKTEPSEKLPQPPREPAPSTADTSTAALTESAQAKPTSREDDGGNVVYVPTKLPKTWGAQPHPGRIVETQSMAATDEPDIVMKPNIPWDLVKSGAITEVQLNAVALAAQSHERFNADGTRQGFFVGDGTGVGKGREIAATILHHWNSGVKRMVWVSYKDDLIEDAKRDLKDLNADIPIMSIKKFKKGQSIEPKFQQGIVFVAYTTLAQSAAPSVQQKDGSKTKTPKAADFYRVQQLAEWAGEESMIVFDEAHEAKNAVVAEGGGARKGKASAAGQAVTVIQDELARARVLYASATGFTDPTNIGYAKRLGLWGDGTAFPNFGSFNNAITRGGVGAMEMVARDMKAQGKYVSRFLSYAGVEFRETIHQLTENQQEVFEAAGNAWRMVFKDIASAMQVTQATSSWAAKNAESQFWAANQRFYRTILTAMKVPTLFRVVDDALAADRSVVISVLGTGAAATDRALSKMLSEEEGGSLDDLDVSPADILRQFVERSYPIYQYQEVADDSGRVTSELVRDSEGNPVVNKDALEAKNRLLKSLEGMQMPEAALDQIVNRYGPANVAELTGRTQRIIEGEDGKKILEKRKAEGTGNSVNVEEARQFQDGKKRIAIISNAASTGISLHADRRAKNQQRRQHIILDLKWSADDQMQDFGRTHRTNESSQPIYELLSVNVGADKRFSSSIARRLEQLGALSRGDRASSGAGDIAKYNFETIYGKAAIKAVVDSMNRNDAETLQMMGLATEKQEAKPDQIPVTQFLNRLMSLPLERQNRTFDRFMDAFAEAIENAKKIGMFDAGAEKIQADKLEMVGEPTVIRTDEATGARTVHYEINALQLRDRYTWEEAKAAVRKDYRLMRRKTTGRLVAVAREPYNSKTAVDGTVIGVHRFMAASGGGAMEATDFDKFDAVPADQSARDAWDEQFKEAGPHRTEHVHLIGGSVLPIYDRLGDGNKPLKVEIAAMPDGQRILGVRIPHTRIKQVLRSLGHGVSVTPTDVLAGVLGGETYELAGGLKLKKLVRAGQDRIEVVIPTTLVQRVWNIIEPLGGFNENIQFVFRYFLPNDERALEGIQGLLKEFPVVADSSGKVEPEPSKADLPERNETLYARAGSLVAMAGEWIYKARPQEIDKVEFKQYSHEELASEADAIVIAATADRPSVIVGNWQFMKILGMAAGPGVNFTGAVLDTLEAYSAMSMLQNWGLIDFSDPDAAWRAMELRQKIEMAMDFNGHRGFVFMLRDKHAGRDQVFAQTLREELTHWQQHMLGKVSEHVDTDELIKHPLWRRIAARLDREGYGSEPDYVKVIEAAAKIAAGQRVNFLLSKRQANEWMALYMAKLGARHGAQAATVLRWATKEIRDAHNPPQGRILGRVGQPDATSPDQSPSQGKPDSDDGSIPEGRKGSLSRRVGQNLSERQTLFARQGGTPEGRTFREVLDKSEVRRLREKQRRTDTPDAEYRRILKAVSGQDTTKQLTKAQAEEVFDRLQTATVPLGAMLRSPSRILSRSRFGERIYQAAEDNWFLQERLNERWAKNWEKANKGTTKAERNRIALYRFASQITQMRGEDAAREWLDSIGENSSIMDDLEGFLTPKEKAVNAKWTKLFFEPSRKMGIAEGLIDGKQQFDNYLSFYHDSTLRMNRSKMKDAAADLAREIGVPIHVAEQILDKANPKKVSFGSFDFTRQEWSIPGLRDADMIAEIYRKGFARKVAISRFLAEANPFTKKIVDPALRVYARRYIQQYAGKPQPNQILTDAAWYAAMSKIPLVRRWKPSAGQLAGWATAIQYNAKIGFNLFTPMLNLTQTVLNTMPYAGTRRTLSVLPRAMASVALPMRLNPFVRDVARLRRGGIFSDDPAQSKFDRPIFHGAAEVVQKAGSFLFDKAESLNRATAYLAGLEMAAAEGLRGEDAVRRARETVRVTQFYSGRLDAPLFSRTPGGKILMQFKTFTVKQLEFVGMLNRRQQMEFAAWTVALGGPASVLLLQAFQKFFPDWEVTEWMEEWNESWNVAAWLQAERLKYQMGVFTVPGVEFLGSGRLSERMAKWMGGPTLTTVYDLADSSVATLNDPAKFDKWAESVVRGMVPGGVEWLRAKKAWEEAEDAGEAVRILTGTEGR